MPRASSPLPLLKLPHLALWSLWLAILPAATGLASPPLLYHSPADDGVPPGAPPVLPGSPAETLYLYLDLGPAATAVGTACVDGDGDEICHWEFQLERTGPVDFDGFQPDPGRDVVFAESAGLLAATGGDALLGEPGPIRLGELDLAVSGPGWSVSVGEGSVVDAGFAHQEVQMDVVALPEPHVDTGVAAAAGALGLLGLARRRRAGR